MSCFTLNGFLHLFLSTDECLVINYIRPIVAIFAFTKIFWVGWMQRDGDPSGCGGWSVVHFWFLFLIHTNYNVKKSGKHVAKNTKIFLVKR